LECGRYIERNPVRAGIVKEPGSYQWSSYNYYAYNYKSDIIKENPIYAGLGVSLEKRQLTYREYVSTARLYEKIIDKEFCIK
jgi:putative transposase